MKAFAARVRFVAVIVVAGILPQAGCGGSSSQPRPQTPHVEFRETSVRSGPIEGETCTTPGEFPATITKSHSVKVVGLGDPPVDLGRMRVRSRVMAFGPAIALASASDQYLVSFFAKEEYEDYLYVAAPVLESVEGAGVLPGTRILAFRAGTSPSRIRAELASAIAVDRKMSFSHFTLAVPLGGDIRKTTLRDLVSAEAAARRHDLVAHGIQLLPEHLDRLLPQHFNAGDGTGLFDGLGAMIELDPPSDGSQTDPHRLLLWYRNKGATVSTSGTIVCE